MDGRTPGSIGDITSNQVVLVRVDTRRKNEAPIWQAVMLILDEVAKAATGEIVITAMLLANSSPLGAGGFIKRKRNTGRYCRSLKGGL